MGDKKKRKVNRVYSKIDKLPKELRDEVEEMIRGRVATYGEITEYLMQQGVDITASSVARYAKRYIESIKMLELSQDNLLMISREIEKHPDIDATEALVRMVSSAVTSAVARINQESIDTMEISDLLKQTIAIIRAAAYKKRVESQNKDAQEAAINSYIGLISNAIAADRPQLYAELMTYLETLKGVDLEAYAGGED